MRGYEKERSAETIRLAAPIEERILQLLALGLRLPTIVSTINDEFKEMLVKPMNSSTAQAFIHENKERANNVRENITKHCREELSLHAAELFRRVAKAEQSIIDVFSSKLTEALTTLSSLDIDEQGNNGKFINISRTFQLLELIDKYHTKAAKLVGTEAMRDIETFRAKAQIKKTEEEKTSGLMPAIKVDSSTRFL
jgi:hypothetical protein